MTNLTDPREIWDRTFYQTRFNSIHGAHYSAVGHQELERNCFLVQGMLKRGKTWTGCFRPAGTYLAAAHRSCTVTAGPRQPGK